MAKKKSAKTAPPPSFEVAFEQLKTLVGQLEGGQLTLTESLACYEEGISSLRHCYRALNQAQQKIGLLVALDEDGRAQIEPFDEQATGERPRGGQAPSDAGSSISDMDDSERLF